MQDIQELCERVIVIDKGTLIFEGTLETLTERYSDSRRLRLTFEDPSLPDLSSFGELVESTEFAVVLAVPRAKTAAIAGEILQNYKVQDIAVEDVSADEVIRDLFDNNK